MTIHSCTILGINYGVSGKDKAVDVVGASSESIIAYIELVEDRARCCVWLLKLWVFGLRQLKVFN
jgi:hypothetical protein